MKGRPHKQNKIKIIKKKEETKEKITHHETKEAGKIK